MWFLKMVWKLNKNKIEAITNWPIPVTVTDVGSIHGFTNYYRQFIPNYAHIDEILELIDIQ